jgi:hypothetical protein
MAEQPKRVIGKPFAPGNPGRPKGARHKLSEMFVKTVLKDFEEFGAPAVVLARMEDPLGYMRVVASLLPKELTAENGEPLFDGITVNFVRADKPKS